ncbi:hypothetical protein Tco_0375360 [Tanacetum coccineum]
MGVTQLDMTSPWWSVSTATRRDPMTDKLLKPIKGIPINKMLLAFNSNLLCAFSSVVVGAIVVSTPSTTFVIGGALPFS